MSSQLSSRTTRPPFPLSVSVYRVEYWNGGSDGKGLFSQFPDRPILVYLGSVTVQDVGALKIGDHVTVRRPGSEVRCKILREPFPEIRSGVPVGHMVYAEPITERAVSDG